MASATCRCRCSTTCPYDGPLPCSTALMKARVSGRPFQLGHATRLAQALDVVPEDDRRVQSMFNHT